MPTLSRALFAWLLAALLVAAAAGSFGLAASSDPIGSTTTADPENITLFSSATLRYNATSNGPIERDGVRYLNAERTAEITLDLPPAPADQREARRIMAVVNVRPVLMETPDKRVRPGDPWTRLGYLTVVLPSPEGADLPPREVEVMRFVTGFGGANVFRQDVTSLAPLLHGSRTLRLTVDTWLDPGWEVTVRLVYDERGVGFRRPVFAEPVFYSRWVTAEKPTLRATVRIPEGLNQPRLRIVSTGHADDGRDAHEFVTSTHILKIDGKVVAMWRPWREDGGPRRDQNQASGRWEIDGRSLWSSDIDRSGWVPGVAVGPLVIPLPELTPGEHVIELEVLDIRAPDPETNGRGYWVESAIIVADEPWPNQ